MKKLKINRFIITFFIFLILIFILFKLYIYIDNKIKIFEKNKNISFISVEETYKLLKLNKKILLIDARHEKFYNFSRIKNAISFPYYNFDNHIKSFLKKYDKNIFIIIYCDSKFCSLSEMEAEKFIRYGYLNVHCLKGGIEEWVKKGYPIITSY